MSRTVILLLLILSVQCALSWRYETRCTKITDPSKSEAKQPGSRSSPIIDDLELESTTDMNSDDDYTSPPSSSSSNHLTLRCPNTNDFLFIGLTQYGVVTANRTTTTPQCESSTSDCLVTVDYLANECNGLNSCRIQLDAQFLHSCKRHSDYLSLAYECIPGAQRVDVCSSDETFLIDSTLNANKATPSSSSSLSRFGAFYLTSPGYPNEYADNLKSCSCRLEYVKIESSPSSLVSTPLNTKQSGEISLALSAYEFDLEEGTDENVCNKDYFTIETEAKNETLCGNYKQFRELYAHGQQVSLNFHSDDFITRRGFLFKISTIARTQCPANASARFDSTRCVSLHSQRLVSWSEASRSCVARGGRLLAINDFVDAMRMSSSIKTDEQSNSAQYWVASSKSKSRPAKCASKSVNGWNDEKSCSSKRPYICEYDAVKSAALTTSVNRGMSDTNGNRLIRVTCGQASTLFAASNSIVEKSTLSTTTLPTKSIASNSIKNTQRPEDKPQIQASSTVSALIVDYDDEYDQENAAATSSTTNKITTSANEQKSSSNESQTKSRFGLNFISQDYLIIIAVVCGFAIVLIAINIFCIWNYYNKKLNGHFHRGDFAIIPETHHSFRQSSTLLSKSGKNTNNRNTSTSSSSTSSSNGVSGVTNRTLSSCLGVVSNAGGTYIRVPVYDLSNPRESTDSGISGASFKQLTPAECLRMLLNNNGEENSEVANHYYETLSKRQQQQQVVNLNEYHVYNPLETDKFIMPTLLVPQQHQQQSTMVLLTTTNPTSGYPTSVAVPTHKASQYSSMIYGDLGTSYGGSSTASGGSTKPLLSFVAAANNINNASSVSADAEIESVTASDSSSSTPPNV